MENTCGGDVSHNPWITPCGRRSYPHYHKLYDDDKIIIYIFIQKIFYFFFLPLRLWRTYLSEKLPSIIKKILPSDLRKILPTNNQKKVSSELRKKVPSEVEKKVLDFYNYTTRNAVLY